MLLATLFFSFLVNIFIFIMPLQQLHQYLLVSSLLLLSLLLIVGVASVAPRPHTLLLICKLPVASEIAQTLL